MSHPPRRFARLAVVAAPLVALAALTGCLAIGRPATRQGPVAPRVWDGADPAVLVANGKTYLFGTTNNKKVPVREITTFAGALSSSKSEWDAAAANARQNDAMPTRPPWANPTRHGGTWQIWAPSAVKIGTTYYLYFAASRSGANDLQNDQCIGRASSTNPMGPYTPGANPLYCGLPAERGSNPWGRGALDPEVFKAPDGKLYLLMALSRTKDNIGVIPLASNGLPSGPNATPRILASQRFGWHDGTDDGVLTSSQAFLENPSMIYEPKTKTYLLFYSAGQWWRSNYNTGFGRCSSPMGPCTLDARAPFLVGGAGRSATGGLTAFKAANGDLRVAYASWTAGRENQSGGDGSYSRKVHWSRIAVTNTTSSGNQTVRLSET